MVSVAEALKRISNLEVEPQIIELALSNSVNYVLAEDCVSPINMPPFEQSAMDGYAINLDDNLTEFTVVGEIKAGDSAENLKLSKGEAFRIFTGSMLPDAANSIVKQEDVERVSDKIKIVKLPQKGENIRFLGEQIKKDQIAVLKDVLLTPGVIGFISMLGFSSVKVYRKPKITIIATGNELVKSGNELKIGQIYESNTNTLLAALSTFGFESEVHVVEDSYNKIRFEIEQAIEISDLVIMTGGISVGDYDFVSKILSDIQVEEIFYKVKQKPGKPLFLGKKEEKIIFALPGNPAAVLTTFYIYVLPILEKMVGRKKAFLRKGELKLSNDFQKTPNLSFFLKGYINADSVSILPAQSSAMLSSFVEADCLIFLEENKTNWIKNELVSVCYLN